MARGARAAATASCPARAIMTSPQPRLDWPSVLRRAKAIVEEYQTEVTLRQLFYRLVAAGVISNQQVRYQQLSAYTAKARREGWFPDLMDRTRGVEVARAYDSPDQAREVIVRSYRRDRTEGQDVSIYLGVEKAGLVELLKAWFWDLGIPILALRGFSSQTFVDDVVADVEARDRPAVLLYGGDWDASGESIDQDFIKRTNCWQAVQRIALTEPQVIEWRLPEMVGKARDSRAQAFIKKHGRLAQVELDAVPPDQLRRLFADAVAQYWNSDIYDNVMIREAAERAELRRTA